MNKWKLRAQCALAILRGRGVIYGMCFTSGVHVHPSQQELIMANCQVIGDAPRGPLNTDKILAGLEAWVKGEK